MRASARSWRITAVDANHCPGAAQFIFERMTSSACAGHRAGKASDRITERYLHTGDCRYHAQQFQSNAHLQRCVGSLDALYLDTTYCNPKHSFPDQVIRSWRRRPRSLRLLATPTSV